MKPLEQSSYVEPTIGLLKRVLKSALMWPGSLRAPYTFARVMSDI